MSLHRKLELVIPLIAVSVLVIVGCGSTGSEDIGAPGNAVDAPDSIGTPLPPANGGPLTADAFVTQLTSILPNLRLTSTLAMGDAKTGSVPVRCSPQYKKLTPLLAMI